MTNSKTIAALYRAHSAKRQERITHVLEDCGFDALVIHSGTPFIYFSDDREAPFYPTPHFAHWTPLPGPHHLLLVRPRAKPFLVYVRPQNYWREHISLDDSFWLSEFDFREVTSTDSAWKELNGGFTKSTIRRIAYIGDNLEEIKKQGVEEDCINPKELLARLDSERSYKTSYEVACISEANRIASVGHKSAREVFLAGASELEIHHAYMKAVACVERELPYETIVALNEKGAILHYQGKRAHERNGTSLLLDAGTGYRGYASDITRTYAHPDADPLFKDLLSGVEKLQRELCDEIRVGMPFVTLHENAHQKIAELLIALGILKTDAKTAMERGLTKLFFPHGVGHMLGLQVHDVGAPKTPELRNGGVIKEGQVFTVEPGVYFIEMLFCPHRTGTTSSHFNWELIDRLAPYGGVRIEDDVLVAKNGIRNLTREFL